MQAYGRQEAAAAATHLAQQQSGDGGERDGAQYGEDLCARAVAGEAGDGWIDPVQAQ
jgi:hypothetical protein